MNIFKASILESNGVVEVGLKDGNKLSLTEEKQKKLKDNGYIGKEVFVGIRPEHLHEASADPLSADYSSIKGTVDVAEIMGSETYLHLKKYDAHIIARVTNQTRKRVDDDVELQLHWNNVHLFDMETEKSI